MDNAQKAIMLGVGLFITIIVIAAVMAITGIGQQLIGSGQTQLSGISGQLATQLRADYDNQSLSGSQVKTLITKFYNDNTIAVYVVTENAAFTEASGKDVIAAANGEDNDHSGFVYRSSAAKLTFETSTTFKMALATGSGSPSKFSQNRNIQAITVDNTMLESETNPTPMSTVTAAVNTNSMFKSILITNSDTGSIVGIIVVRYQ